MRRANTKSGSKAGKSKMTDSTTKKAFAKQLKFDLCAGDFSDFDAAMEHLESCGFSVGSMQRDDPIGIMFGDFCIAKWRNLSLKDRGELHGTITGDKRNGPVVVTLWATAPQAAIDALKYFPHGGI